MATDGTYLKHQKATSLIRDTTLIVFPQTLRAPPNAALNGAEGAIAAKTVGWS